jgi:hypothetical protein
MREGPTSSECGVGFRGTYRKASSNDGKETGCRTGLRMEEKERIESAAFC